MKKSITIILLILIFGYQGFSQSLSHVNHTEFGLLVGKTNNEERRINFSFQTFNGVKPHPNHELGFLIGLDTYPGFTLMPLALGWRGIQNKKRTSLYASMDIGYGSALLEKRIKENQREYWYQGGLLISPAIGIRKKSRRGEHSYSWSLGFKKQKASFFEGIRTQELTRSPADPLLPPGFHSVWEESYIMNSLFLKWGVVF